MTEPSPHRPKPQSKPKATFGGETVEPRILMSVTWLAPGTAGNDTINGTAGNDGIDGLGGADTLLGNGGDDVLRGGTGNDSLQGGAGIDIADYSTANGSVTVSLQTNTASGAAGSDTLNSIEGVIGSDFDDQITGNLGNNTLSGGGGNDLIISSWGNDTVDGGAGTDTIDYRNAFSAVTVDLTRTTAQNTGLGGGIDTLSNLEGVVGSAHNDTFAFATPVDGALYTVSGGAGSDKIDLSGFASSAVTFANGHVTIEMGEGKSFGIDYNNIETIQFADVDAVVVTSNINVDSFVGSRIFVDGDEAFRMDFTGSGSVNWSYSTGTDTLTITDTNGTGSDSGVTITDLTGTELVIGTIAIDNDLGSLVSNVDIGTIQVTGNFNTITTVTIAGGAGTLGSFVAQGRVNSPTLLDANVGTITLNDSLQGGIVVSGDLGALTAGQIDVNGGITVRGSAGSLATGDVLGEVRVDGSVGSLSTAYVAHDITILGDLGSASISVVDSGATITVQSVVGTLDFQVGGVQHGGTFATVTKFVFDGATQAAVTSGSNVAPIASAGPDQVVAEGDLVTLTALTSSDADGDQLRYLWVQTSGPTVKLSDDGSGQPTFVAPQGLSNTSVTFDLVVADGEVTSIADSVTITINADNDAPTANAGPDQSVAEGDLVRLNGRASTDPEGQALTYTWVQTAGPTVTLSNASAERPTFTAPEGLTNTVVQFSLTVSDGTNTSSVDTVTVTINADDDAPIANAGTDQTVGGGAVVTLDASASQDPEAQGLTYTWTQVSGPAVALSDPNAAQPTFTPPNPVDAQGLRFQVAVSDGTSVAIDTVDVTLTPRGLIGHWNFEETGQAVIDVTGNGNDGQLGSSAGTDTRDPTRVVDPQRGNVLSFDGTDYVTGVGMGPSGDFSIAAWMQHDLSGGTWQTIYSSGNDETWFGIEASTGKIGVNVGSSDDWFETADGAISTTGWHHVIGTWDGTTGRIFIDGVEVPVTVIGTPTDPVAAPAAIGAFAANTNTYRYAGKLDDIRLYDVALPTTDAEAIFGNLAPTANAGADQTVNEGDIVTLTGLASSDPEAQALAYAWVQTSGPEVTLSNTNAAQPTFTAPEGLVNTAVQFSLTVTDGVRTSSVDMVTVTINADNDAPTANAGADQAVAEGDVVTLTGLASTDPEVQGLTYTWVQTSGPAVTLSNANAAQPTFTAPEGLTNTAVQFSLTVSDGSNTSSVDTVTVTINADNAAPTVDAGGDQTVAPRDTVQLRATGQDTEDQALSYTWRQVGGTPVTLSDPTAADPTFVAPKTAAGDTLVFAIESSDGTTTATDTVSIVVGPNVAPIVQVQAVSSAGVGETVMVTAGAADADGDDLRFQWTQLAGPTVGILNGDQANASFVSPQVSQQTYLVFQVEVSDGTFTATQVVAIAVVPPEVDNTPAAPPEPTPTPAPIAPEPSQNAAEPSQTPVSAVAEDVVDNGLLTGGRSPSSPTAYSAANAVDDEGDSDDASTSTTVALRSSSSEPTDAGDEVEVSRDQREEVVTESDAAEEESIRSQPDLVIAEAGREVELVPNLPVPVEGAGTIVWTQVGGTAVSLDRGVDGTVRVRLPEVFTEEELVFEATLLTGDERVVQEITVQVQPVAMATRAADMDVDVSGDNADATTRNTTAEGPGLGRIWAALVTFFGGRQNRSDR